MSAPHLISIRVRRPPIGPDYGSFSVTRLADRTMTAAAACSRMGGGGTRKRRVYLISLIFGWPTVRAYLSFVASLAHSTQM